MSETQSPPEELNESLKRLVCDKLWAAYLISKEYIAIKSAHGGVVNRHLIGRMLYYSLFQPQSLLALVDEIDPENEPRFETERRTISTELPTGFITTNLEVADFVQKYCEIVTTELDSASVCFPGSREAIISMSARGPVTIWTSGDEYGIPDLGLPGSNDQTIRVTHFLDSIEDAEDRPQDIETAAAEDKMSLLPRIVDSYREQGVQILVLVDDREDNLRRAQEIIAEHTFHQIRLVVVHNNTKATYEPEQDPDANFTHVESVEAAAQVVSDQPEAKVGWIVDFDGVISDTQKKKLLEEAAVLDWLKGLYSN